MWRPKLESISEMAGLSIKRGGPHGHYQYEVTGTALEDQLYLIVTVMPTISVAYDLKRPGYYINPEQTWISLRYQSKAVALFKHETPRAPKWEEEEPLDSRSVPY